MNMTPLQLKNFSPTLLKLQKSAPQ